MTEQRLNHGHDDADAPTEAVRGEWRRRIEAEYRSAVITQQVTLWLSQTGAPLDLIRDGLRVVDDELVHAELSSAAYEEAGGQEAPELSEESLQVPAAPDLSTRESLALRAVEIFCLGETVAVRLFKHLREGCTVPVAREALDRILLDEVRHRDFGWDMLDWMMEDDSGELRDFIASSLPAMLGRLRSSYAPAMAQSLTSVSELERAWGLMPPAQYGAILERTVERDYTPRFAAHGINAVTAWSTANGPPLAVA